MSKSPDNLLGEVVSRATMAVVGLALLFGGYTCLSVAYGILRQYVETSQSGNGSGAGLPGMIGIVLLIVDGFFLLAALVPVRWLSRLVNPPAATLHGGAEEHQARGIIKAFRFFGRL